MAQTTYRQALVSEDQDFVKNVRASLKSKFTRTITALETALVKISDSAYFDHSKIDYNEVVQIAGELKIAKEAIDEVHLRYEVIRSHGEGAEEDRLVEADSAYITDIETRNRSAVKSYNLYLTEHKAKAQIKSNQENMATEVKQFPDKVRAFKLLKADYEKIYSDALKVVESDNITERRTALYHKELLSTQFKSLSTMGEELLGMSAHVKTDTVDVDKELFDCSKERLNYRDVTAKLEQVSKDIEQADKIEVAKVAMPATDVVRDIPSSVETKANIKLKVKAPTFSGKCREFAVFKRDFETIVAVNNRPDIEIGALLKENIPSKFKYLVDKVPLDNYKEMMEILTAKFGRARLIVDECTAEIRNMKLITTDREFISFVEHIDKLKRDLEQLNLLADIANTLQ